MNGTGGEAPARFNFLRFVHKFSQNLIDKHLFSQYQLDGWTVSWQNGRLDIAPEYLYERGTVLR
ncbi:MAG: DUF2442 domain-containing protein, partial [Ruminococcus sp.]|nr:DUF2442 domain-containing protein [Ruminococcus sp.]